MDRKVLFATIAIGMLVLSSCREVDTEQVGGELIPGTSSQYRFCDGPTLIYYTDVSGSDDEFDAIWPGLCVWNKDSNKWEYNFDAAKEAVEQRNGNVPEDK